MGDEATGHADGSAAAADGIDRAGLEGWFGERVADLRPPLEFERIAGGLSNLTYRVSDGCRPALGAAPAAARQAARLGPRHGPRAPGRRRPGSRPPVPVAPLLGLCEDEAVTGAPFYVMEFVEGPILRGLAEAEIFPDEDDRRAIGERVADTLAAIHAVDPDAVGLGDLGRKQDYVARQLRRWQGQWEKSKTRELAAVDRVHERLAARIPEQGPATLVHGDYRLDNMILAPSGEVAAVVDWELCTLGDPLADVGTLMAYWPDREEAPIALGQPANLAPGFPTREELVARYAESSGRDISELDFFLALGYWKLAIILEGVYARYAAGAYGEVPEGVQAFARMVERLAEAAEAAEARQGLKPRLCADSAVRPG